MLDGSGTIFRHVRVRQADETARAVRDTPERAFAALAVMAYRRDVDLARFELELGRDREMRALAAAVSATTIGEIADLAGRPRATSATAVPPQTASPPSALAHAA